MLSQGNERVQIDAITISLISRRVHRGRLIHRRNEKKKERFFLVKKPFMRCQLRVVGKNLLCYPIYLYIRARLVKACYPTSFTYLYSNIKSPLSF